MFQLGKPNFAELFDDVDFLMVDEAQDMNPTTLDIVKNQHHLPRLIVGDPYQQIYQFRGSKNALTDFGASKTFFLTQSFRFGSQIAYFANTWLRTMALCQDTVDNRRMKRQFLVSLYCILYTIYVHVMTIRRAFLSN